MSEPSIVAYTGNGSQTDFVIPFDYMEREHVKVSIDSVETTAFTFVNDSTIRLNASPAPATLVKIYRRTDTDPFVVFSEGYEADRAENLNKTTTQALMVASEARDVVDLVDGIGSEVTACQAAAALAEYWAGEAEAIVGEVPAHIHPISQVTDLQTSLNDKATVSSVSALTAVVNGKQPASANLDTWSTVQPATAAEIRAGTQGSRAVTVTEAWSAAEEVTLTYGATITPNFATGFDFKVTLTGNTTLANPQNLKAGQRGRIRIAQDSTGSRTMAFGSYWKFAGAVAPSLSGGANKEDFLDYEVVSTTRIRAALTKDIPA